MDGSEKRVLRRKTGLIAVALRFDANLAYHASKQGLLSQKEIKAIMRIDENEKRIGKFLQFLEKIQLAGFEKFCYLLDNQGLHWLSDELLVELICEKGHLHIDEHVLTEARSLVQQKLGCHVTLAGEDVEEVAVFIAKRYQVAREVYARQQKRLQQKKIIHNKVLTKNIKELCHQIDKCLIVNPKGVTTQKDRSGDCELPSIPLPVETVTVPHDHANVIHNAMASDQFQDVYSHRKPALGEAKDDLIQQFTSEDSPETHNEIIGSDKSNAKIHSHAKSYAGFNNNSDNGYPIKKRCSSADSADINHLISSLETKVNELSYAYISGKIATDGVSMKPEKTGVPVQTQTQGGDNFVEATGSESDTSGDDMNSERMDEMAEASAKKSRKVKKNSKVQAMYHLPKYTHTQMKWAPDDENSSLLTSGVNQEDDSRNPKRQIRQSKSKSAPGVLQTLGKGKKISRFGKSKKTAKKTVSDDDDSCFEDDPFFSVSLSSQDHLRNLKTTKDDIVDLARRQRHIRNTTYSASSAGSTKRLEELFWKKRAEYMQKARSRGYYFVSEDRNNKLDSITAQKQRGIINQTSQQFKQDFMWNLYRSDIWSDSPTSRDATSRQWEDESCPGAYALPGRQKRRCLACAYASGQLAQFYDTMAAPSSGEYVKFPALGHNKNNSQDEDIRDKYTPDTAKGIKTVRYSDKVVVVC